MLDNPLSCPGGYIIMVNVNQTVMSCIKAMKTSIHPLGQNYISNNLTMWCMCLCHEVHTVSV
ncbi:hypothetical protein PAXRUDRAFT_569098 [Paxillus rubicundulus Ve08.2h10]|uniref:Uncharacterized protein n=1 Tax=Paxillus rubicundulus Ve08.2h10 TaxID=930991 RepID=A0A0D0DKW2_9AGAM|nr:hypothetical protein PAXRUDRAFT_569098 [Paxillus rubicundulus Ve08.2h10]